MYFLSLRIEIVALHSFSVWGNTYCRSLSSLTEHPSAIWTLLHHFVSAPVFYPVPCQFFDFFFSQGPMLNILWLWTPNLWLWGYYHVLFMGLLTSQSTDWAQKIKQKRILGLLRQVMVMQCFWLFFIVIMGPYGRRICITQGPKHRNS
jgi:hypothetical protein